MERIAIIDLGSNSARLIIMHIYPNRAYNLAYQQKEAVRLSQGMSYDNQLQPEAMTRAIETLKTFSHMCKLFNVDTIIAVATAAVRNATNSAAFIQQVQQQTGITLKIISGEEEGLLGYTAVVNTLNISDCLLFDLGGGSTELTLIQNRKPIHTVSLPFGAVNTTERFGTTNNIHEKTLNEMQLFIQHHLDKLPWMKNIKLPLVGIGGTARTIAKMDQKRKRYPFAKIHNYRLGKMSFESLWQQISIANYKQRRKICGLNNERADIILAGAAIIKCLFDFTQGNRLIISNCGVREGLFLRYYLAGEALDIIPDILEHSAHNILLFHEAHTEHAEHVTKLTLTMFDGWQEIHNLSNRHRTLLKIAALLHDIGITINYYGHARHSAYLIENARLFGLTHREQMLTAIIAGWHNGPTSHLRNRLYNEFLDDIDWESARKLAALLALGEALDTTQTGPVKNIHPYIQTENAMLELMTENEASIEYQAVEKVSSWFKKTFDLPLIIKCLNK